jgi:alpha-ribazole phosphatase/probable phosphoglycerate mutase
MRGAVDDPVPWDRVLTSPLRRCREFAEQLGAERGLPVQPLPDLREIGFGAWEGLTHEQVSAGDPSAISAFWERPTLNTPPGAEALGDFGLRVGRVWRAMLNVYAGQHLLAVCHGVTIRVILAEVLTMPLDSIFRLQVPYAARSRIRVYGLEPSTVSFLRYHAAPK